MSDVPQSELERSSVVLIDNTSSSSNINQEATIDQCAIQNNLKNRLFEIIKTLQDCDTIVGNPNIEEFQELLQQLLECDGDNIDLTDNKGNTFLHYTVKNKWDSLTKLLLDHKAYIGVKNANGELPIEEISYKILSDFFDSCITSNDKQCTKNCPQYKVIFDYSCMIKKSNSQNKNSKNTNQLHLIQFISESKHLKQLIIHPLIHYLIWSKSNLLIYFFLWKIMFLLSMLSLWYIIFYGNRPTTADQAYSPLIPLLIRPAESKPMFYILLKIATIIFIVMNYIILAFKGLEYIIGTDRFLVYIKREYGALLFILGKSAILVLILCLDEGDLRKLLKAIAIMVIAFDSYQLLITDSEYYKMSVHFIMLKKITWKYMKVTVFSAILFFAFLHALNELHDQAKKYSSTVSKFKVIEFDVYVFLLVYLALFFIFTVMIMTVLTNLLQHLTFSGIDEIRQQAEITYLTDRLQLIASFINFLTNFISLRNLLIRWLACFSSYQFRLRTHMALCKNLKKIIVKPNIRKITNNVNNNVTISDSNITTILWNKINEDILNKSLVRIQTKLDLENSIAKENDNKNMSIQINQMFGVIMPNQPNIELIQDDNNAQV